SSNNEDESASNNKHNVCWDIVQFHPSYNYEDFVRGIEVDPNGNSGITYKTANKILGKMAKEAKDANRTKYVLIIDEINRAPLASVLGELIYALEYRGDSVTTPYTVDNSQHLVIPDNLIIIGTMNTADRSIGSIDYAVRRRFTFINLPPDEEVIKNQKEQDAPKEKALRLFDAVTTLFGKKDNDESNDKNETNGNGYMDPEFYAEDVQIGHTYFLAKSDAELKHKFIYQVIPVLKEYIKDGILINNPCLKFKITTSPTSSPTNTTDKPIYLSESFNKIKGEIESCWSKIYVG
ncbi:MAG: AAA domain-containing protein, partial [Syntrophomonadaceae bacterium]|nr:AAA domain-containing protein [Syntrophomonadaceae bacterium]